MGLLSTRPTGQFGHSIVAQVGEGVVMNSIREATSQRNSELDEK